MYLPLQEPFLDELFRTVDSHSYNQVRFLPRSSSWSLINSVPACARIRLHTRATDHFHMDTSHRSKMFHMVQARHPRKRSPRLCRRSVITRCLSISLPRRWWIHPSRHPPLRPSHRISRGTRPHHIHIHPHIHPHPRPWHQAGAILRPGPCGPRYIPGFPMQWDRNPTTQMCGTKNLATTTALDTRPMGPIPSVVVWPLPQV